MNCLKERQALKELPLILAGPLNRERDVLLAFKQNGELSTP